MRSFSTSDVVPMPILSRVSMPAMSVFLDRVPAASTAIVALLSSLEGTLTVPSLSSKCMGMDFSRSTASMAEASLPLTPW